MSSSGPELDDSDSTVRIDSTRDRPPDRHPGAIVEQWIREAVTPTITVGLFGSQVGLTDELLRVSGPLGAVSALHFAVHLAVDETYQAAFTERILDEVERQLAVRAVYLALRAGVEQRDHRTDPNQWG